MDDGDEWGDYEARIRAAMEQRREALALRDAGMITDEEYNEICRRLAAG